MVKEDYTNISTFQFKAPVEQVDDDYVDEDVLKERQRREESIKRQELIAKRKRKAAAQGRTKPRRSSNPTDLNGKPPPPRSRRKNVEPRPSLPTIKETSDNNLQERNNTENNTTTKVQENNTKDKSPPPQIPEIDEKRKTIKTPKSNKLILGPRRRPAKPVATNSDNATVTSKSDAEASQPKSPTAEATTVEPETNEQTQRPQTVKPTSPKSRPQSNYSQKSENVKTETSEPGRYETALSTTSKTSKAIRIDTLTAESSKSTKSNGSKVENKRPGSSKSQRPEASVSNRPSTKKFERPDTVQSQATIPDRKQSVQEDNAQQSKTPRLSISTLGKLKGMFSRRRKSTANTSVNSSAQDVKEVAEEEKAPNETKLSRDKMESRASSQTVKEISKDKEEAEEKEEAKEGEEEEDKSPCEEKSTGFLGLFKKKKTSILSSKRSSVVSLRSIPEETPTPERENKAKNAGGWGRLKTFLRTDSPKEEVAEKSSKPTETAETTPNKQTTREPKPIVIINGDLKGDKAFQSTLIAALRGDAPSPDNFKEPETRTAHKQHQQKPQHPLNQPKEDTSQEETPDITPQVQGAPQVIIQPMMMMPQSYPMMYPQMWSPYGMMSMQPQMMMLPGQTMWSPGMLPMAQSNLPLLVSPQSYSRHHSYAAEEHTSHPPTRKISDPQVRFPPIYDGIIQQPQSARHLDRVPDPLPPLPTRPTPSQLLIESQKNLFLANNILNR